MSDTQGPTGDDEGFIARTAPATGGFLTGALGGVDLRQPFREAPDLTTPPRSTWRILAPLLLVLAAGAGAIAWSAIT